MMKALMRIWGMFPLWVHTLAAIILRPRFRVGVAALVFDEQGRVLLFKHTYRKFAWGIPVGGLEYGEQPEEGVIREFYEESGLTIKAERLLFADSSKLFHFENSRLQTLHQELYGDDGRQFCRNVKRYFL